MTVQHPDSILVESPLPGGIATVVRALFQLPSWVQIVGAAIGFLVGVAVVVVAWKRRVIIWQWIQARSRRLRIALVVVLALAAIGAAGFGFVSWDYMQHDNAFCTGCHVMGPAFERFTQSEHAQLNCHDCHQQSMFASMRQMYLWVTERPHEIGPHAPVSNQVCGGCHVEGEEGSTWPQIAETAGHRLHFESDTSALDELMCVTCHGQEVHRFVPIRQTCAQAGCHDRLEIRLGGMAEQTSLHCVTCHEFTAGVPRLATTDSARGHLVPNLDRCFSCHEMQALLPGYDRALDPHRGSCGACHNAHTQEIALQANTRCTECHVEWRAIPFHSGTRHVNTAEQCTICHEPHRARVDASGCTECHERVSEQDDVPSAVRRRLQRLAPFDTTMAVRDSPRPNNMLFVASLSLPASLLDLVPAVQDTFSHQRHSELACTNCHTTTAGHGGLTFEQPRGCQICHHRGREERECSRCHEAAEMGVARTATMQVTVADQQTRERSVNFSHERHGELTCARCHTTPVTLVASAAARACTDCHESHHAPARSCGSCHSSETVQDAHTPPADAHVACDACHASATVARLMPDRSLCATCHQAQAREHYPAKQCTTCHMLASPEAYRPRLTGEGGGQ